MTIPQSHPEQRHGVIFSLAFPWKFQLSFQDMLMMRVKMWRNCCWRSRCCSDLTQRGGGRHEDVWGLAHRSREELSVGSPSQAFGGVEDHR